MAYLSVDEVLTLDGNKRTGWVVMRTFRALNGHDVGGTEDERFALIVGIAQGMALDEAEAWRRDQSAALP